MLLLYKFFSNREAQGNLNPVPDPPQDPKDGGTNQPPVTPPIANPPVGNPTNNGTQPVPNPTPPVTSPPVNPEAPHKCPIYVDVFKKYNIAKDMLKVCEDNGLKIEKTYPLKTSQSHLSGKKQSGKAVKNTEVIYVLKR